MLAEDPEPNHRRRPRVLQQAGESFSRYCTRKTRLYVVCHGQRTDELLHLLAKGVSVRYLVVPSPLAAELPQHPRLECRVLAEPGDMRTFHFAFAEQPDMFWLEADHPPDSLKSRTCEWVTPITAERGQRLKKLKDAFGQAWQTAQPHRPEALRL